MDDLADVEAAYGRVLDLCRRRDLPLIEAQATVGEASATVWLDVNSEESLLGAVGNIIDACAVKLVAACRAVDGDEQERSIIMVGSPIIGLRFGVPVEDDFDSVCVHDSGIDPVELEEAVTALRRAVVDEVSSTSGLEPSNSARIRLLLEQAIASLGQQDEHAQRAALSSIHLIGFEVEKEIRRQHQRSFAEQAERIADVIIADSPGVLSMNRTTLRPHVYDHLRQIDHECATQRSGEPIVLALVARAKAPSTGLF